jgi:hypothetical protein
MESMICNLEVEGNHCFRVKLIVKTNFIFTL